MMRYQVIEMVKVDNPSDIEKAVWEFNRIFQNPVTHCCRFYTNYYLGKIKEFKDFDFELKRVASKQSDAFYNYSIYSCAKEMMNVWTRVEFGGVKLSSVLRRASVYEDGDGRGELSLADMSPKGAKEVLNGLKSHIEETAPTKSKGLIKEILLNNNSDENFYVTEEMMIKFCKLVEDKYRAFTEPEMFLSACRYIFGQDFSQIFTREEAPPFLLKGGEFKDIGWKPEYGGKGWESVAKTALLKDDFSDPSMVDLMWSVEHNNGKFIDKVPEITDDELSALRKGLRWEWEKADMPMDIDASFPWIKLEKGDILQSVLPVALDFGKEENIEPLFKMAQDHFEEFSDRQLRHIDLPRDEWFVETKMIQHIPL